MSETVKPCPFCGSKDLDTVLVDMRDREGRPMQIVCADCGASGPSAYFEDENTVVAEVARVTKWNRRAAPAPEPGDERNRLTQIFLKCARFKIYIDGNKWCATFDDFENLQESPVGFGDDEYEAVVALLESFT